MNLIMDNPVGCDSNETSEYIFRLALSNSIAIANTRLTNGGTIRPNSSLSNNAQFMWLLDYELVNVAKHYFGCKGTTRLDDKGLPYTGTEGYGTRIHLSTTKDVECSGPVNNFAQMRTGGGC